MDIPGSIDENGNVTPETLHNYVYRKVGDKASDIVLARYPGLAKPVKGGGLLKLLLSDKVAEFNNIRNQNSSIKLDFGGTDLHGKDLHQANLGNAFFPSAIMYRVDLRSADLSEATLVGANLIDANLQQANLQRANLKLTNLANADLTSANLQGADLEGANLQGVRNLPLSKVEARQRGAIVD